MDIDLSFRINFFIRATCLLINGLEKNIKTTLYSIGIVLAAVLSLAVETPESKVSASIESSSASVKYIPVIYVINASCTYSVKTMLPRVKNPVLKIIICYEGTDGVRYHCECYSDSTARDWTGSRSLKIKEGIEAVSKRQTEVDSSLLRGVTVKGNAYGGFPVNKGYKVLAVRTELWLDGKMLCNHSQQNQLELLKLELPEDWYIKGKNPAKIKYLR